MYIDEGTNKPFKIKINDLRIENNKRILELVIPHPIEIYM